jgi:hypothetical protein
MNEHDWQLAYDLSQFDVSEFELYGWMGAGVALLAAALFIHARRRRRSVLLSLFIGVVAGLLGYSYVAATRDYHLLTHQLARGDVLRVEGGIVAHQVWQHEISQPGERPRRHEPWESIVVGGVTFMWPQSSADTSFHNAGQLPLADGTPVRITYVEGYEGRAGKRFFDGNASERRIVRLEIRASADRNPDRHEPASAPGGDRGRRGNHDAGRHPAQSGMRLFPGLSVRETVRCRLTLPLCR